MGLTLFPFRRTRSGKAAPRPAERFRPRVEGLEDRLTPSGGLLDPTFGSGGIVNLPSTTDNGASAVVVQPDGKVVIAGNVTRKNSGSSISVQRLNRDGTLDTTFNRTGSVTIQTGSSDWPNAVILQPDGRILVGGGAAANNGTDEFLVARLNTNGTLDTTFGSKGLWVYAAASAYPVKKLAVLTDPAHPATVTGIVAGANGASGFEAIKLTPAGVPDKTFGSGGFAVFANLSGGSLNSVAVAPSGEIYLAGYVAFAGMNSEGCLAAVTPSGSLDPTFGGGAGYLLIAQAPDQYSEFYDVTVQTLIVSGQPVSRLVASGDIGADNAGVSGLVAAYTLGGALDTSFGSGGTFTYTSPLGASAGAEFTSVNLEADGSIVVGEQLYYIDSGGIDHHEMLIGHLTAAGAADTSFGTDGTGFVGIAPTPPGAQPGAVAIDPTDGSIVAGGATTSGHQTQATIVRLTAP